MSKISDARTNYKPRTTTVTVCLDTEVAEQRDVLLTKLAEARQAQEKAGARLTQKSPIPKLQAELAALEDREREHMHVLRFTKLDGLEWVNITATHPARPDSADDLSLGYNNHAASIEAAKVNGVEIVEGKADPVELDDDDWATILEVGSGWDVENIVTSVMNLNVLRSARKVARLKKD
jgi:hypothetical protein